jgi:glyoxylase-like metal-dependent hydrolase (beta-lactamase superfamily II)
MTPLLPVAAPWYAVTRIDDSVTLIEEPHVNELLSANTWHVRGERMDVLIDTGLGVVPLKASLAELFADREPVVVLTHAHLDHMGSAHEFTECWAHEAEPVGTEGRGSLLGPELTRIIGLDERLPDVLLDALPDAAYDVAGYRLRPANVTHYLEDGELIDLGDRVLRVLHLPGHSPGSICLYDQTYRTLFSGDVVYDGGLLDDIDGASRTDYLDSMGRLLDLDVALVHPGHGPSFDGERLATIAQDYVDRTSRLMGRGS